jgi:predicted enzyme related to lactoylglutathione lyase
MRLRQVAQRAEDLGRAVAFYADLIGAEPVAVFDPPGLAFFDLDGTRLLLDTGAPSALLYLQVDDVPEAVERLRARGAAVSTEPHVVFPDDGGTFDVPGDEWLAFVTDSEGNEVGLMARAARQP